MGGQRAEQLDLGDRHPGVAEQRQPWRQVARSCLEPLQRRGVPLGAGPARLTASASARHSGRLPGQVGVELVRPAPSVARPADQSTSSCGRWAAYDANRPASRRATA